MDSVQQSSSAPKAPENLKAFSKKPLKSSKKIPPPQNGEAKEAKPLKKPLEQPPLKVEISQTAKVINKREKQIQGMEPIKKLEESLLLKNKPGVFFLSGFDIQGLSSGDGGVGGMAENVPHGRHFSWEDEDSVLEEITRTPIQQPIILVGHSLGGDAAVSLANRLNSMEHGFRNVDLLVTLDSVGFDNDLIPPNVKRNLNFIADEDVFFNDGPNIARDEDRTKVFNEIRSEKHTGIDDSKEVQKKIFSAISGTLSENRNFNELVSKFSRS
ncbi:MAG: hypothetical protein CME68_01020 [Halobacteriovoraceae bacterium]|nr:hypothetical protein [Halobacteriovoraceae bacterium]